MTAAEMWDQYGGIGKYSAWQFGGDADCLAKLVKSGKKRATSSALVVYEAENAPLPKTGDHSVILAGDFVKDTVSRKANTEKC